MAEKKTADVLRLQVNVPETIAVKFTDGLAVSSNYGGDQIMFTLCDGRKMFLPPIVAKKIAESGVEANQPFEICKREIAEGNRRRVEYQVAAIPAPPPPPPARPARPVTPISNVTPISANGYSTALAAAVSNGNGHNGYAVTPTVMAPDADPPSALVLKIVGMQTIDAALEVEAHARMRGLTDFAFSAESIEKLMVSLFIDVRQRGGRL